MTVLSTDGDDALWVSRKLAERKLFVQEHPRAQARMSGEEMETIASVAAERLNRYNHKARVKVIIPLKGFSSLSVEGGPLYDPASDEAFRVTLKKCIDPEIEIIEANTDINSRMFAGTVTEALSQALKVI